MTSERMKKNVKLVYRLWSSTYEPIRALGSRFIYGGAEKHFYQKLREALDKGSDILDMGCGTGVNLAWLQDNNIPFGSYLGVDLTPEMLKRAKMKVQQRYAHKISFMQMDLDEIPSLDKTFDVIISTFVLEHTENPRHIVEKAYQKLKRGGTMILLFCANGGSFSNALLRPIFFLSRSRYLNPEDYERFPGVIEEKTLAKGFAEVITIRKTIKKT